MTRAYKLDITESEDELKDLLRKQKVVWKKERVQVLYLLKTQKAKTIKEVAEMLGRHRVTVQDWLKVYRQEGLQNLITEKPISGRPRKIPQWAEKALDKRLQQEEGFNSYGEITQWLEETLGIIANYKTVHKLVHYRLQASPKVARPESTNQASEQVENFKKKWQKT